MINKKPKILVVDDEEGIRNQIKWAISNDYEVSLAGDIASAKSILYKEKPNLVMLDLSLTPDSGTGSEGVIILQDILSKDNTTKVIMITGNSARENALKCVALGAYDFYSKPINIQEIKVSIKRALYIQSLERDNSRLLEDLERTKFSNEIISECEQMKEILDVVRRVSTTDATILIQGETGTGKELIARIIHFNSGRIGKPFVAINCGAIPENLLESELFGHEKGAFTNAYTQKKGKLEHAQNGTVFLDEIAELSPTLQVKILRFLQEKEIERIGGREPIQLDARVIAATNKNLENGIIEGTFREDLYYRLNVISIQLPPLRERGRDIILLANAFLNRFRQEMKVNVVGLSDDAISVLSSYNWPGNIRELENKIKRAVIMTKGTYIIPEDLNLSGINMVTKPIHTKDLKLKEVRDLFESQYIKGALKRNKGNITHAADSIGITRSMFYSLMDKYNLA
jgi:two-component system NtrC family response regulator